jgi:toxin CptA
LLTAYLMAQALALLAVFSLDVSTTTTCVGVVACLAHGLWTVPRTILITHRSAFTGLRRDAAGWQVWSERGGWQSVQVCGDSVVLPVIVILRFRIGSRRRLWRPVRSLCIPCDALAPDTHRRLRVRLRFSRGGLAAPE